MPRASTSKDGALRPGFFADDAQSIARRLIGVMLLVDGVGGTIVETEAYDASDPASHSYRGPTTRNASMFGPAGHAYVYRSYGIHWCLNFVCGAAFVGSAVLVRAIRPELGIEAMIVRRGTSDLRRLCSGPGRLCQALAIDGSFDGRDLDQPPFALFKPEQSAGSAAEVVSTRRIGISAGIEAPWRFCLANSPHLSRPYGRPADRVAGEPS